MPYRPKKPCAAVGCPNLTNGQYCEQHVHLETKRKLDFNRYHREPFYNKRYGKEWKKIRARFIKAHPLCEQCLTRKRYTPAAEVHHKLPLSEGGTHDEQNLMALCHVCHSSITMTANNLKT
jgi:5-methylcytosine-specific restriction protein A